MTQPSTEHWDEAHRRSAKAGASWFESVPTISLEMIAALGGVDTSVIDIGGGTSTLADELIVVGHHDVTVLDISREARRISRSRSRSSIEPTWIIADVVSWSPTRRYDIWHDRAVLHFLIDDNDRDLYQHQLQRTVSVGGGVVIGVFAPEGPTHCSGLEVRRYSADDLIEFLGEDFLEVERRIQDHSTPNGAIQPFSWIAARRVS